MRVLIDGDILLYEVGFGVVKGWKGEGIPSFDYASELMDYKIGFIRNQAVLGSLYRDFNPEIDSVKIFLSGLNNFRIDIAKKKGYKENRAESKRPFHYYNLKAYLQNAYDCEVTDGIEADDALCIERHADMHNTVVCSRDKDLRQHEGYIYSWEVGNQPSFGPVFVSGYGEIELVRKAKVNTLTGVGYKFFLSQVLTGDKVDNYPGLPGCGPVAAFKMLEATTDPSEGLNVVMAAYSAFYGPSWAEELTEQARLAWLLIEKDKHWSIDEILHRTVQEQDRSEQEDQLALLGKDL